MGKVASVHCLLFLTHFIPLFPVKRRRAMGSAGLGVLLLSAGCASLPVNGAAWDSLLDPHGKAPLTDWKVTPFGGQGEVEVHDGVLLLDTGYPLTGITRTGSVPKIPFELKGTCRRLVGSDFFCGLTFPVEQGHLSLILGGWGGATCGLSNLDGDDASMNASTFYLWTPPGQTIEFRLVVEVGRVRLWLDGEKSIDQDLRGVRCEVRPEMLPCLPLGFACFSTSVALDGLMVRPWNSAP